MDERARDLLLCRIWDRLNLIHGALSAVRARVEKMADGLTQAQIAAAERQAGNEAYLHRVLVGFDQMWNVVAGGEPDETISSRAERDAQKHELLAVVLSKALDIFQRNHGQKAQAGDLERADTVAATEADSLGVSR